jgi:hypothetical protein
MATVLFPKELSLSEVEERFGLRQVVDPEFFLEWQQPRLEVVASAAERLWLDQVRSDFLALSKHSLHEEIVKLVVVGPLLSLAGLCRPPFLPVAERQVEIQLNDREEIVRGRVDLLVLHRQLWVTTLEAKRKGIDVAKALPQALFYMLNSPQVEGPTFGLATNGSHFIFIKLLKQPSLCYALSEEFSLRRTENELYRVVGILRSLGQLIESAVAA